MALIEITEDQHGVLLDLKYATPDNFTRAPIYHAPHCYLHEEAEGLLRNAIEIADKQGYRFRIFDAFRPSEAQWKLWNHTPDPEFLADPRRGSPHSRGAAIDLTLVDQNGNDLEMGTGFDAFTPLSHHGNMGVSLEAQKNRLLLMGIMTTAGWDFYRNEWWHYQLFNARRLPTFSDTALPNRMMG
ncbi:D-alanyl-D-alanine dipeptidase [Terasakiella sp. SH-1]|uniref:D-alanyl-D-alanine dipeptidase n=1 Tax=Terasakiella sp. SH-1 TaxID=2560057 RepID=UPI0010747978|nr:D-alanyl-D-alanine dipeptidase [Terasakiella sp. SH-1]